jgi:UDP-N-acetylglucosamine 2-epimerase (non-hydrolysing)
MKVMTILGTRPEIIRLSLIIKLLDKYSQHLLVHTGQNYEECLSKIFFEDLDLREPDIYLGIKGNSFADQVGQILWRSESLFLEHRPDRLLILGDTNSGLSAIPARRLGIPVYHLEAGNRCYDDRVPEEINRRVIDHTSSILMPYTYRSMENLQREGIPRERIYVIGNPIMEVIEHYRDRIAASRILSRFNLAEKKFFLATLHRAENVDLEDRLSNLMAALAQLNQRYKYPVVVSLHPRTKAKLEAFKISLGSPGLRLLTPLGFFDFVRLEQAAFCLLSDSGTVQEEACIFRVPNVTIRDVTERPETLECGSNMLSGCDPKDILKCVELVTQEQPGWEPPPEYLAKKVAVKVCRILLGFRLPDLAEKEWLEQSLGNDARIEGIEGGKTGER